MDTKSKLNTLLSFLVVAALLLSYSMDVVPTSNSTFYSSSQQSSLCKDAQITSSVNSQPSGVEQDDEDTVPLQDTATVSSSCSISLQVISVEKQSLIPLLKASFAFPPFSSAIASQVFVFQEPDPPQAI